MTGTNRKGGYKGNNPRPPPGPQTQPLAEATVKKSKARSAQIPQYVKVTSSEKTEQMAAAFCMGVHARLGASSAVTGLLPDLVQKIVTGLMPELVEEFDSGRDTDYIETRQSRPYCTLCNQHIVHGSKAVKQHLKSKLHTELAGK